MSSINKICVVGGWGSMGSKHVKRLKEEHPEIEVFVDEMAGGVHVPTPDDCNVFIIATPSETHYEIAKYHLEKGHHVLVEKPLTLKHDEAKELYDLAQEKDVVFLAGHTQRFNPVFTEAVPEPVNCSMIEGHLIVEHERPEEDVVFDLMIHLIELACYISDYHSREIIEILDVYVNNEGETTAIFSLDNTTCNFTVSYGARYHSRALLLAQGDGINQWKAQRINLLKVDKLPTDSLQHMHNYFIEKCNEDKAIDHAKYGVQSVKIAEEINSFLENS